MDYDSRVKNFIKEWESDSDFHHGLIKNALTGHMIPYIYNTLRNETLSDAEPDFKRKSIRRIKNSAEVINNSVWYIVWGLKWFSFRYLFISGRKIIITSLFRLNINSDLPGMFLAGTDSKTIVIHFSILKNYPLLRNSRFYCYPHFFYKRKVSINNNIKLQFNSLFFKHFKLEFPYEKELAEFMRSIESIYFTFYQLLKYLSRRHRCEALIQDCDYLAERVIFAGLCRKNKIKTITFDHSIQLHDHLFYSSKSDVHLVWGEYQCRRIRNNSDGLPNKLIISGSRASGFRPVYKEIISSNWIYFLPAFRSAHMQTFDRSVSRTEERIAEIVKVLNNHYPGIKLLIKAHPSDNCTNFPFKDYITLLSAGELLADCALAFVEDSTVSLELLKYDVKVIYFPGSVNSDNLCIRKFRIDYVIPQGNNILDSISECLNRSIEWENRKIMYEYFFGEKDLRMKILSGVLNPKF